MSLEKLIIKMKMGKMFDARDSIVWDVDIMGDTLWIATIPNYSWEEMTIQQRSIIISSVYP